MIKHFPYLLFLLLPTYLVKLPLNNFGSINLLDIIEIISIIYLSFYIINNHLLEEFKQYIFQNKHRLFFLFLLLIGITTSFLFNFTSNWLSSAGIIKSYFILPISLSVIIGFLITKNILHKDSFFNAYLFYVTLLSLIGLGFLLANKVSYDGRLELFFNSANFYAMTLALGLIIALNKIINSPEKKFFYIIIFLISINLFFTYSLGAYTGLLVAVCLLLLQKRNYCFFKTPSLPFYITISAIIISATLPLLINPVLNFNHYKPQIPANSLDSRIAIYQATSKILKDNWLLGIGSGNFQTKYLAYQKYFSSYPQWAVPHAHNIFLQLWTELGALSLISFSVILLITIYKKAFREALLSCLLLYFIIHGLVDSTIWKNDLSIIFWILIFL